MESPIFSPMPLTLDQVARDRIKHWIVSTGVTQTELAARIGRTQAWMSRYLSGEFDADLETLQENRARVRAFHRRALGRACCRPCGSSRAAPLPQPA
jgi:predicted transcriptional regulator